MKPKYKVVHRTPESKSAESAESAESVTVNAFPLERELAAALLENLLLKAQWAALTGDIPHSHEPVRVLNWRDCPYVGSHNHGNHGITDPGHSHSINSR